MNDKLNKETILVIDDDPLLANLVKLTLEDDGFEVVVVHSARSLNHLLATIKPDSPPEFRLILLDLTLPEVGGEEIFARLRAHPNTARTPVIIVSALAHVEKRVQLLEMGAQDYIAKPFQVSELMARIATQISLNQAREAQQQAEKLAERRARRLEAVARQNAKLLKIEKKRRQEAEMLRQMTQLINSSLQLDNVLSSALNMLQKMIQVESGSIFFLDESRQYLSFVGTLEPDDKLTELKIPVDRTLVGRVIRSQEGLIVNNVRQQPDFFPEIDRLVGTATRSVLCVPLMGRERLIGAIELINKLDDDFTEVDLNLVTSAAGAIAIATDNAELYLQKSDLVEELRISREQMIQNAKMAATGRLAASLAHEINNPLQAIHSCLQLAIHFNLEPDKQAEYLQMADEEVERLVDIVSRILEFSRPSKGTYRRTNINRLLNQVIQLSEKYMVHRSLTLQQFLASDTPAITVIPDQIVQAFLNIILNAIDAMPEIGTLTIRSQLQGDWVIVHF